MCFWEFLYSIRKLDDNGYVKYETTRQVLKIFVNQYSVFSLIVGLILDRARIW